MDFQTTDQALALTENMEFKFMYGNTLMKFLITCGKIQNFYTRENPLENF